MPQFGYYALRIVVDGNVLPEISKNGKTYVIAPPDRDFEILVVGPSGSRTEAVVSVDGLSVMTGEDASSSDRGYLIAQDGSGMTIPGFRLNDSEVAAFHFGKRNDSYAARLGKPRNVGVIAAKFFSERRREPVFRTMRGATRGGALNHDMGTEFGDRQQHEVSRVEFVRDREMDTIEIEYASEAQLRKAGILLPAPPLDSFPGDRKVSGPGCKPPSNWKGGKKKSVTRKTVAKKTTTRKTATSTRRRRG